MSKEIYISSTPHETRLAIVEKDELTEIYYERENEYTLAGSIYNGRVTRVLPGMQSSFVDIGLERDAFLYITDFMEEAGDAADFESAATAGEPRRASGSGTGFGGGSNGSGERRDRDKGRGRNRNEGRNEGRSPALPVPAASEDGEEPIAFAPAAGDTDSVGEGEPGADGSRRWRGRRGRRRGRGDARPGGEASVQGMPGSAEPASDTHDPFPEDDEQDGFGRKHEAIDAAAAAPADASAGAETEDRSGSYAADRGGRQRRGSRDRNRADGPSPGDDSAQREPNQPEAPRTAEKPGRLDAIRERFTPRWLRGSSAAAASKSDHETVDVHAASSDATPARTSGAAEPEPFILPGESLSKYRRGAEADTESKPATENAIVPRPSTEAVALTGWDGGAVLPGETLSRRSSGGPSLTASSDRGSRDRGTSRSAERSSERSPERGQERGQDRSQDRGQDRGERGGRDRRRGRDGRRGPREDQPRTPQASTAGQPIPTSYRAEPGIQPAEAVQAAVTSAHEFELPISVHENAPGFEAEQTTISQPYEAETDVIHADRDEHLAEAAVEFHEVVAEYEPEEASASYRVDPGGAREFRQSAPVEEPAAGQHETTDIHADGEMHSEAPHEAAGHEVSHEASHEPHAEAVAAEHKALGEPHAAGRFSPDAGRLDAGRFAPGEGQLEEELLDDEDGEYAPIHASASQEDMEEETLEGAADLGSMIRDMSIDQITRPEPIDLDDEDDEEDDFDIDEEEMEEDELESNGEDADEDEPLSGSEISEGEEDAFAESESYDEHGEPIARAPAASRESQGEGKREGRQGRRRGRGRDRERASSADRAPGTERSGGEQSPQSGIERGGENGGERTAERSAERSGGSFSRDKRGMAGSRSRDGRSGGRGDNRRHSVQASDLPAISDLLKPGQEVLVQIAKEPIAKKGARITSHIALPGRFLVFMPTVSHVGVSRKIESDGERRRLKEILLSERGDATGGFIVRTAASGASEEELRSDLRFLLNLWADIKTRSESSKSPALIYHDLNLIERILRDQVTDNFSAIWVDTEAEYERVLRFLQRFQPSLIRRVKLYSKETPLFEQFGITAEIDKALRSKVWLKSGGSIVINQTEALVAIDINTGKFVGKTTKLEDTIVKTNLDAIPEIVRQMRLRDLGGIIIIDFIDMDERKNRNRVMAALEEELKKDRAPSKVLPFNDFGLIAITRKRVKQTLERTLSTTCGVCQGTGMTKSPVTVCNDIYIEMRKMHKLMDKGDIMLRVHPEVVKQLKMGGGKWLQDMEELSRKTILIKSDPTLHPEQFDIH